jgi:alkylation response protein AidB-like acyl-CoA dehydrogenase
MRLLPDVDALDFAASVRDLLADAAAPTALRAAWDDADGRVPGLWKRLAEVGVLGLTVPEQYGGSGADLTSALAVLVETGRAAIPEPIVETMVGAAMLADAGGELAEEWLPKVVAGDAVLTVALGPGQLVTAAPWADLFLVRSDDRSVRAIAAADVALNAHQSVDGGRRLAEISYDPTAGAVLAAADADAAFDQGVVAVAAQLTGVADAMLDMAVSYAKTREQFGAVIGSFQAVKHQLANAYVATSFAKPVVARAAWSVTQAAPTRARDASHAKHSASRAAQQAARTALQVHAGIGYTFEHDLHMWMKRTWSLTSLWGDDAWHHARVAEAVLNSTRGDAS